MHFSFKEKLNPFNISLLLVILLHSNITWTQDLYQSSVGGEFAFIYQITEQEAESLYQANDSLKGYEYMLHSLVDSIQLQHIPEYDKKNNRLVKVYSKNQSANLLKGYSEKLASGHYLIHYLGVQKEYTILYSVAPIYVFQFNNGQDIIIEVYDSEGQSLHDAIVKLGSKTLKFDKNRNAYVVKNTNRHGIVKVQHGAHSMYMELKRSKNNSWWIRKGSKTPLYLVVQPFRYTFGLAKDMYKSARQGRKVGKLYTLHYSIKGQLSKLSSKRKKQIYGNRFQAGYIVSSQPKYRMGDTLRVKALLTDADGSLVNQLTYKLEIFETNNKLPLKTLTSNSLKPGVLSWELPIVKSEGFIANKLYMLKVRGTQKILESSFYLDDVALPSYQYEIKILRDKHMFGKDLPVTISVKDPNGFYARDVRATVSIAPNQVIGSCEDLVRIPPVLHMEEIELGYNESTTYYVPDSIFPPATMDYEISINFSSVDIETFTSRKRIRRYCHLEEIQYNRYKDTLFIDFERNEISVESQAVILKNDGLSTKWDTLFYGNLPAQINLTPVISQIRTISEGIISEYDLKADPNHFQIKGYRSIDSIHISSINPSGIPFRWQLSNHKGVLREGKDIDVKLNLRVKNKKPYYISYQYLWAGTIQEKTFAVVLDTNKVQLIVQEPEQIYPGQTIQLSLQAKDYKGKPVANADLTAFAYNSQLGVSNTSLPFSKRSLQTRKIQNSWHIGKPSVYNRIYNNPIRYNYWKNKSGIDKVEFYKFTFPHDSIYRSFLHVQSGQTQIAPFIFHNGTQVPIHMIYIDGVPSYYSRYNTTTPYSFHCLPGTHEISIRSNSHLYTIPKFEVLPGVKNIVSIDTATTDAFIKKSPAMVNQLSLAESKLVEKFTLEIENQFPPRTTLVESQNNVFEVSRYIKMFPVYGQFSLYENDTIPRKFDFEPDYKYYIGKDLLKLTSKPIIARGYELFDNYSAGLSNLYDEALDLKTMLSKTTNPKTNESSTPLILQKFNSQSYDYNDESRLMLYHSEEFLKSLGESVKYWVLAKRERDKIEIVRINLKSKKDFINLTAGKYSLFMVTDNNRIYSLSEVSLRLSELLCLKLDKVAELHEAPGQDSVSKSIDSIMRHNSSLLKEKKLNKEFHYQTPVVEGKGHRTIRGRITTIDYDPIIFANLEACGRIATSDWWGNFEILIDENCKFIEINYVGFNQAMIPIGNKDSLNIFMEQGIYLDHVVITAYKTPMIQHDNVSSSMDGNQNLVETLSELDESKQLRRSAFENQNPGEKFMSDWESSNSGVRRNFSHTGFWKPNLKTDANGQVLFGVQFPDDIALWSTRYILVGNNKLSGAYSGEIRSYKPVMAKLSCPEFLIEGDSCNVLGKITNFTENEYTVKRAGTKNDLLILNTTANLGDILIDRFPISDISGDSILLGYQVELNNSYIDGEERLIPIRKKGIEKKSGFQKIILKDTIIQIENSSLNRNYKIRIEDNFMDMQLAELHRLSMYEHNCNEQIASKLKALLLIRKIKHLKNEPFQQDSLTIELIKKLDSRVNNEKMWGWFPQFPTQYWVSEHVMEALLMAQEASYSVQIPKVLHSSRFIAEVDKVSSIKELKHLTNLAKLLDVPISQPYVLNRLESLPRKTLNDSLYHLTILAIMDMEYDHTSILPYLNQTVNTGVFAKGEVQFRRNQCAPPHRLENTILAYKLLDKYKELYSDILKSMQTHILNQRGYNGWQNTYETITILESLASNKYLSTADEGLETYIEIIKSDTEKYNHFPLNIDIETNEDFSIAVKNSKPIFLNVSSSEWVIPEDNQFGSFTIDTEISPQKDSYKIGDKLTMTVNIHSDLPSEYVMVTIPIPATFSPIQKINPIGSIQLFHKEVLRDKIIFYIEHLPAGDHQFYIPMHARFSGRYIINPSAVEFMYTPHINAFGAWKELHITE